MFSALIPQSNASARSVFAAPAAALLMSALLIAAAVLVYTGIYPSESCRNMPSAFPITAPILKVLICIPSALFVSLMIQDLMACFPATNGFLSPEPAGTAVIICAVIDFHIYDGSESFWSKAGNPHFCQSWETLAVLCFFQFDLIGYDTYIPDEEDVESISFCPDSFRELFLLSGVRAYGAGARFRIFCAGGYDRYALRTGPVRNRQPRKRAQHRRMSTIWILFRM